MKIEDWMSKSGRISGERAERLAAEARGLELRACALFVLLAIVAIVPLVVIATVGDSPGLPYDLMHAAEIGGVGVALVCLGLAYREFRGGGRWSMKSRD